ncbi:MAG: hypothetical protein HY328_13280 [Chloroflexi bacterium]|nr:hypothetical protein [Chloroflexota bacterium]
MPIYMGIDWSTQKHDVAFVNEKGGVIQTEIIEHSQAGFAKLEAVRRQMKVEPSECIVGMETAHSLLIDYDNLVIAETLRTNRHKFRVLIFRTNAKEFRD